MYAMGLFISTPGILTKEAETMKKMSKMNTTSINGETLIDSSSSRFKILLRNFIVVQIQHGRICGLRGFREDEGNVSIQLGGVKESEA